MQPEYKEGYVDTVANLGSMYKPMVWHTGMMIGQATTLQVLRYMQAIQL